MLPLNDELGKLAEGGWGLDAVAEGVEGVGAAPLLNSAQRGHLRFVSVKAREKRRRVSG